MQSFIFIFFFLFCALFRFVSHNFPPLTPNSEFSHWIAGTRRTSDQRAGIPTRVSRHIDLVSSNSSPIQSKSYRTNPLSDPSPFHFIHGGYKEEVSLIDWDKGA